MKKLLLSFILILGVSFSMNAQDWSTIYTTEFITIEKKVIECNPYNNQYPFSYYLLKYTNETQEKLTFNFEMNLFYNDVLFVEGSVDASSEEKIKQIQLMPSEVKEGNCDSRKQMFKVFYKNSHPKIENKLTKFVIEAIKTK